MYYCIIIFILVLNTLKVEVERHILYMCKLFVVSDDVIFSSSSVRSFPFPFPIRFRSFPTYFSYD